MRIEEAIAWIHGRLKFGSRPGLDRVQALLAALGNPEQKVPVIHIAGTNGKGSTVAYLRSMLEETGLTVGSFTSPYIESFNERIAINSQPIPDEELIEYVQKLQPLVKKLDEQPALAGITEFELLTALMLCYFLDKKVDIAIVEVGLGGLLDSTNVVQPILTAITTIGYDHMDILGETLEEIAQQKAGIIKKNIPIVTGIVPSAAFVPIEMQAKKQQAPMYRANQAYDVTYVHPDPKWGEVFDFSDKTGRLSGLKVPLLGHHQVENAGVAIELYRLYCEQKGLPFEQKTVQKGLLKTRWPARMEKINEEPLILLDGAHNGHAIKRLVENMKKEFHGYQINVLFSALATKDVHTMLSELQKIPHVQIYLTTFDYPNALDLTNFTHEKVKMVSVWQFGLGELLESMGEGELLLVTGSLYFVSDVRQLFFSLGGADEGS